LGLANVLNFRGYGEGSNLARQHTALYCAVLGGREIDLGKKSPYSQSWHRAAGRAFRPVLHMKESSLLLRLCCSELPVLVHDMQGLRQIRR